MPKIRTKTVTVHYSILGHGQSFYLCIQWPLPNGWSRPGLLFTCLTAATWWSVAVGPFICMFNSRYLMLGCDQIFYLLVQQLLLNRHVSLHPSSLWCLAAAAALLIDKDVIRRRKEIYAYKQWALFSLIEKKNMNRLNKDDDATTIRKNTKHYEPSKPPQLACLIVPFVLSMRRPDDCLGLRIMQICWLCKNSSIVWLRSTIEWWHRRRFL